MNSLRRALYAQAAVWGLAGLLVAVAPGTLGAGPELPWIRIAGVEALGLSMVMVMVGHRVEELWWWSWGFALVSVGVTAVVLLFAAVGVHDTHPGGPFWWSFGVVDLMLSLSLLYGLFVSSREQPLP